MKLDTFGTFILAIISFFAVFLPIVSRTRQNPFSPFIYAFTCWQGFSALVGDKIPDIWYISEFVHTHFSGLINKLINGYGHIVWYFFFQEELADRKAQTLREIAGFAVTIPTICWVIALIGIFVSPEIFIIEAVIEKIIRKLMYGTTSVGHRHSSIGSAIDAWATKEPEYNTYDHELDLGPSSPYDTFGAYHEDWADKE